MSEVMRGVVCGVRLPKTLGRIGVNRLSCMCEEAVEYARSKRRNYGLVLQQDGKLVMDLASNVNHKLMVAAFNLEAKPADLAEDVRFEVINRGLL